MILSSRLNNLEGFPERYRSVLEEKFDIVEVDQYSALPSAYNQDIVGVITYGRFWLLRSKMEIFSRGYGAFR